MILRALSAMAQNKVKRLLAYSSIGHVGYLFIGFSCGTIFVIINISNSNCLTVIHDAILYYCLIHQVLHPPGANLKG
jgi:NADH:ubiquinone oxidoreductase subunit 2 (subunit N)